MVNKRGKCLIIRGADFQTKLVVSALPLGIFRRGGVRWFFRDTVAYGLYNADNCLCFV